MALHKFTEKYRFDPQGIVKPEVADHYKGLFNGAIKTLKNAKDEAQVQALSEEILSKINKDDFLGPTRLSFLTAHGFRTFEIDPTQGQ